MRTPSLPLLMAILASLLCACSKEPATPGEADKDAQHGSTAANAATAKPDTLDPCSLLQPKEVEAVFGAALAGPPFRAASPNHADSGKPRADGEACWYMTPDFQNILIEAEATGGSMMFQQLGTIQGAVNQKFKGALKLQDGSMLTGEWDEARLLNGYTFMALRGDSLVTITFGGSAATEAQAATLADAALKRLDQPLPIDGNAGAQAVIAHEHQRPTPVTACELLTREDVEAVLGKVASGPEADGAECGYMFQNDAGQKHAASIKIVAWRDGYRDFHESLAMLGGVASGLAASDADSNQSQDHVQTFAAGNAIGPGPWDMANKSGMQGLSAVKNDVLITVDAYHASDDQYRALMTRIYQRLGILDRPKAPH